MAAPQGNTEKFYAIKVRAYRIDEEAVSGEAEILAAAWLPGTGISEAASRVRWIISGVTSNGFFSVADSSATPRDFTNESRLLQGSILTRVPKGSAEICVMEARFSSGALAINDPMRISPAPPSIPFPSNGRRRCGNS